MVMDTEILQVLKNNITGAGTLIVLGYIIIFTLRDISRQLKANWSIIDQLKKDFYGHEVSLAVQENCIKEINKDLDYMKNRLNGDRV